MKIDGLPELLSINPNDFLIVYNSENNITGKIKASNLNLGSSSSGGGNTEIEDTQNLWLPSNASIQLWLDANNLNSLSKDGDNNISQWNDISGNGNHLYQTNSSKKPKLINFSDSLNKKVVSFDGIDDYIKANYYNYGTNITMYFVCKFLDNNKWGLFDGNPNQVGALRNFGYINGIVPDRIEIQGNDAPLLLESPTNEFFILECAFELTPGRKVSKRINGDSYNYASSATTSQGACSELCLGAINFDALLFKGSIAEVIFMYSPVAIETGQKVVGYLANKWHLKSGLSATHPYKLHAPTI